MILLTEKIDDLYDENMSSEKIDLVQRMKTMGELTFFSTEILKLLHLIDVGFQAEQIVRMLALYEIEKSVDRYQKAINEISKLSELVSVGFNVNEVTEAVFKTRNIGEVLKTLILIDVGFKRNEIVKAMKSQKTPKFETTLCQLNKGKLYECKFVF